MLILGAVAYDPKVVTIWDGFQRWLGEHGLAMEYVLYRTYEQQVEAHLRGEIDVAWNSPLAWLQTERRARAIGREAVAFAMRDTDRDLTSVIVVGAERGITSADQLRGGRIAVGAYDSPQATLIPLLLLADAGLGPADVEVVVFDVLAGKHGDHVGGERDAARALARGEVDAACVLDANLLLFAREGTLPSGSARVLLRSAPYDHCVFTAIAGQREAEVAHLRELLLSMSWDDPEVRPLLELEGLRQWKDGRTSGFGQLARAVDELSFVGAERVRAFVAQGSRTSR